MRPDALFWSQSTGVGGWFQMFAASAIAVLGRSKVVRIVTLAQASRGGVKRNLVP